ncbi:hypothetical protein V2J09_001503 [Rumex salicifolius]
MHLKHFHAYVQTQFPHKLKSIQCDHGREFDNNELRSFFSSNGVVFRFSCPHTSQQNGKAEQMIRTITNTVRTLLFHGHLPPHFWVEALHTAVYLLNITPTTTLALRTPHQALFHQIPNYTHLRVFGCLCFPNLTATTAHKLEPRTRPCVFLGYALQHRGTTLAPTSDDSENPLPLFPSDPTDFRQPTVPPSQPRAQPCAPADRPTRPLLTYSRRAKQPTNPPPLPPPHRPDPPPPPSTRHPHTMVTRSRSGTIQPAHLLVYIDDIILTASRAAFLTRLIRSLSSEFAMTDLGPLHYFLGISVTRTASCLHLNQEKYAHDILDRASMLSCNPCKTPIDTNSKLASDAGDPVSDPTSYRSIAGALQYLTFTRPDISYVVQ